MIAKSKPRQPRAAKTAQSTDIEDRIRHRAYQLYEQRGRVMASPWMTGCKRKPMY